MAMADYSDVDYFQEVSSSIERVQQLASHQVQLNLLQCRYLSSKLAETGSFLKAKSGSLKAIHDRADIRRTALLMLYFAAKRGEDLVRKCCCEMDPSWLESAVTLGQIKEHIKDILLDLRWWTSMVDMTIASFAIGENMELELLKCAEEDFERLLNHGFNDLDEAVAKDNVQLLTRLHAVLQAANRGPHEHHEYLLAVHLRSRLENTGFETTGNIDDAEVNTYEMSGVIGMGGFGAVMNVKWHGRKCALKMLRHKCREEATSLSAFQHPHIVQFLRYWEAPFGHGMPHHRGSSSDTISSTSAPRSDTSMDSDSLMELQSHILMELMPMDLAQHMTALIRATRVGSKRLPGGNIISGKMPMSVDVVIDMMLQLAKAMSHLNSKDVAHRDLKASNILVRPVEVPELSALGYFHAKLADFGLSKTKAMSSTYTNQTSNVGTTWYRAPEVFDSEFSPVQKFPRKADVWSFGIIFSEALTFKPPYVLTDGQVTTTAESELQLFPGMIRKGLRPALPETCPEYLKFCITNCWALRPQDRPNFSDLWKMLRYAQVRSLGLIQSDHDLFTFNTRDSVKRLHGLEKTTLPLHSPNLKPNPIRLLTWRIKDLLLRNVSFACTCREWLYSENFRRRSQRREPSNQHFFRVPSRSGRWSQASSSHRPEDKPLDMFGGAVGQIAFNEGFRSRGGTVVSSASMQGSASTVVELQDSNRSDACKPINKEHRGHWNVVSLLRKVVSGPALYPRHFYGNQCRVLKEQLILAKEILSKGRVSSADPWPQLAITEVRRVVKFGKALIKSCQQDKLCHKAYLRQGERTQAFAETLKEIGWCMSVVTSYYPSMAMDEFPQVGLGDKEQYLLQEAAFDDQRELEASLAIWVRHHSCSCKECGRPDDDPLLCLAAQMLARASNSAGDRIKDCHTSVLWKTSQEALEDGMEIGSGSSATVTETTWLGDKYAKKEFDMVPKDFEDEANALSKLNHVHIVKVSAYSVGSHTCFFLMERMPGNLRKYMNQRMNRLRNNQPFSMLAAIDLLLQISEAMSYMNSKEMVHRDLKPQNILVEPVGDPEGFVLAKLADFGLARSKHEITSHSHLTRKNLGTSKWRAPEMFKEAMKSGEDSKLVAFPWKADVYSFGIVCSEVLTGMLPFHHVVFQMEQLYNLLTDSLNPLRPKLPENCPESLASLICQCWHTDPAERPTFEEISSRLRYFKGQLMMVGAFH